MWHSSGYFLWNLFGWTERSLVASVTTGFLLGTASFGLSRAIQLGMSLKLSRSCMTSYFTAPFFYPELFFIISLFCCINAPTLCPTVKHRTPYIYVHYFFSWFSILMKRFCFEGPFFVRPYAVFFISFVAHEY